jgi:hypothetical protein
MTLRFSHEDFGRRVGCSYTALIHVLVRILPFEVEMHMMRCEVMVFFTRTGHLRLASKEPKA